jgi:phage shock protein A
MTVEELKLLRQAISQLTAAINGLRQDLPVIKNDIRAIREKIDVLEARKITMSRDETNGSEH